MTIDRMIALLEIEHECMLRGSHVECDRHCENCDLVQDDSELHEMYTNVIALMKDKQRKEDDKTSEQARNHRKPCTFCGGDSKLLIPELENIAEILFNKGYNSFGNVTFKAIELLKGQRWIPIDEETIKAIDIGKAVLVYCPKYKNTYTAYTDGKIWHHFTNNSNDEMWEIPRYYMPLPKPPKDGDGK